MDNRDVAGTKIAARSRCVAPANLVVRSAQGSGVSGKSVCSAAGYGDRRLLRVPHGKTHRQAAVTLAFGPAECDRPIDRNPSEVEIEGSFTAGDMTARIQTARS